MFDMNTVDGPRKTIVPNQRPVVPALPTLPAPVALRELQVQPDIAPEPPAQLPAPPPPAPAPVTYEDRYLRETENLENGQSVFLQN